MNNANRCPATSFKPGTCRLENDSVNPRFQRWTAECSLCGKRVVYGRLGNGRTRPHQAAQPARRPRGEAVSAPKIITARASYIVERDEQFDGSDSCLLMLADGSVRSFRSPAEALRYIKRIEKRNLGPGLSASVATIEWRDGLVPPKGN